jgi:hypothetical protein
MRGVFERSFLLVIATVFLGACSIALRAQTGRGTVTGTVTDTSHAVVPGAQVTLINTATGVEHRASTSSVGVYYFGALPIGTYKLVIRKPGFQEWEGTFYLAVAQNAVANAELRVGATSQVVEVKGAATPLDLTGGSVSDVMDSNEIRDMPLNGRQIGLLFNLVPGVESGAGGARVNGMKVGSLAITLDGVSLVDRFGGGIVRVQPGIETIQEFRATTVGSDAKYAQPATVTMATRSGTNQIHGGAYEYIRDNTVLGPTRLRTDPVTNFHVPELIRNEFGGYLGGPVVIPHLYNGKDKSFWFFDYEGLRDHERFDPSSLGWNYVPTEAMWNGDLSNAVDVNTPCTGTGVSCPAGYQYHPITIYNPTTTNPTTFQRAPFPNNQIPGPFNKTAMVLKSLTALPTNNNNPFVAPNFTSTYPQINRLNNYTGKWDQNISDKDRLSVRYTRSMSLAAIEGGYFADPINPSSGMGSSARNFANTNVGVEYTRSISPNWLNELLVGVLRDPNHYGTLADFTDWAAQLGTPNPFGVTGWPTMYTEEASPLFFGWDSDNNHLQHLTSESLEDNVTWIHGRHTIQFGFQGRMEQNNVAELQQAQGSHNWGPDWTSLFDPTNLSAVPDTGSGFAQLLLGLPDYLSNQYLRGYFYFRQTILGLYFNDRFKVTPRLTLSFGLRWDDMTPYSEARNRLALPYNPESTFEVITPGNHDINSLGIPPAVLASWASVGLKYGTADSVGYTPDLFRPIYHDFGPRLGIAYQLNSKTVLRGSYGIYYVPMPLAQILQPSNYNPPLDLRFQNNPFNNANVPGGLNGPYFGLYPYVVAPTSSDYLPTATVDINQPQDTVQAYGNTAAYWDGANWNNERQQTWNFTFERELPGNTLARLSYIGTWGSNLQQGFAIDDPEADYNYAVRTGLLPPGNNNLLRPVPQWGLYGINHTGYSHNNSLQAEIQRKFANGIAFDAFYTYSRFLTTTDPSGFTPGNVGINAGGGSGNLGGSGGATVPENIEILGEPNLSYQQRLRMTYFNSTTVPPSTFTLDGIFNLPFGRGEHFFANVSKPLDTVIGGWQVATIFTWNSGLWMGVNPGLVQTGNPSIPASKRATFNIPGSSDRYREWFAGDFDPTTATNVQGSIVQPAVRPAGPNCQGQDIGQLAVTLANGTCYNAPFSGFYNPDPRDNIIGPGMWNDDLSLYKHFKIGERLDMRFGADFFNAFNHPNDVPPNPSTGLQDLSLQNTTFNAPRVIQLSLRLQF